MASKYPFKRDFYEDVVKSIQENGATFVLGPRRCGKTVCLTQVSDAYENKELSGSSCEYVDFKKLNTEQQGMEVLSRIQKSIEDDEDKIYLLDEITYAPLPEKYICKIAYLFTENAPHNTKVVFSGSQSLALDKWGHIAFCGSAGFIRTDFLSYKEWLRYKNIEKPSEENYERFLYETPEFYKIESMEEYLQACLDETVISNNRTSNIIYGNDCFLLDVEVLLDVCYATLFTLHKLDLDKRISESFDSRYRSLQNTDLRTVEQAFLFLKNCGLITVTPVVKDLENIPDISLDFRLIIHGEKANLNFKDDLFNNFNMCIKYPAFYIAILKDILKEQMPDHLPKGVLGSIVECHARGMLPEELAAEYHDSNGNKISYTNVVYKTAVEITISNKPIKETHFDCLPDGYKCCLLTKDRMDTIGNIQLIPYYDFINNGAKWK